MVRDSAAASKRVLTTSFSVVRTRASRVVRSSSSPPVPAARAEPTSGGAKLRSPLASTKCHPQRPCASMDALESRRCHGPRSCEHRAIDVDALASQLRTSPGRGSHQPASNTGFGSTSVDGELVSSSIFEGDAVSRNPSTWPRSVGAPGVVLDAVTQRAREAGVLRPDFGSTDLGTLVWAMSKVISMSDGTDAVWRRHLGFVLDGLRAT